MTLSEAGITLCYTGSDNQYHVLLHGELVFSSGDRIESEMFKAVLFGKLSSELKPHGNDCEYDKILNMVQKNGVPELGNAVMFIRRAVIEAIAKKTAKHREQEIDAELSTSLGGWIIKKC